MKQSGIVAIRNLKTDYVWLYWSDDIQKTNVENRFKLDMGTHPCKSLQRDYTNTGLEVFRFETVLITDNPEKIEEVSVSFEKKYI